MFSETSLLHAMPPTPRFRVATSAPISRVMNRSSRQAASIITSKTRPNTPDMRCMSLPPGRPSAGFGEKLFQPRAVLWTLLDDTGPAGFVGFVVKCGALGPFELDHLNAGSLLLGDVRLVLLCRLWRLRLEPRRRIRNYLLLRGVELLPARLVDQDAHFRAVETGIDAVFGLLMPAEIEDAGDGPAVAIDHAAFERGVNLAGRGLHNGGAKRLEEIAVHGRDAQFETREVRLADRLGEIDVEGIVVDVAGKQDAVELLLIELRHIGVSAVAADFRHRPLCEL